jgi:hypothetical protein
MSGATKLALRPYLEAIENFCRPLDREGLLKIILSLAGNVASGERAAFLAGLSGKIPARQTKEAGGVKAMLKRIDELQRDIVSRAEAIEEGSPWDEGDEYDAYGHGYDYYDDEGPPILSEEIKAEFRACLGEAGLLFLDGRTPDARDVYARLLAAVKTAEEYDGGWIDIEADLREGRARYCRCVYELAADSVRVAEMLAAMEVKAAGRLFEDGNPRDYPMLQDVIDAQTGEMQDFSAFLPAWEKALAARDFRKNRLAGLHLEAAFMLNGVEAVAALAGKWKAKQPMGYLAWCARLKAASAWPALAVAAREALAQLPAGHDHTAAANFLIEAGLNLNEPGTTLEGKRERFASTPGGVSLLSLVAEAGRQGVRTRELAFALKVLETRKKGPFTDKMLHAQTLLMAGCLEDALSLAAKEKALDWSYGSSASVVFAAILRLVAGGKESALIKGLFDDYGSLCSVPFDADVCGCKDEEAASMQEEIMQGLALAPPKAADLTRYHAWARKIGETRVNQIVSNKHRGAYDRAASVLGALAEALAATGEKAAAGNLLQDYYQNRYNRYAAFRKELKKAVNQSPALKWVRL